MVLCTSIISSSNSLKNNSTNNGGNDIASQCVLNIIRGDDKVSTLGHEEEGGYIREMIDSTEDEHTIDPPEEDIEVNDKKKVQFTSSKIHKKRCTLVPIYTHLNWFTCWGGGGIFSQKVNTG